LPSQDPCRAVWDLDTAACAKGPAALDRGATCEHGGRSDNGCVNQGTVALLWPVLRNPIFVRSLQRTRGAFGRSCSAPETICARGSFSAPASAMLRVTRLVEKQPNSCSIASHGSAMLSTPCRCF
jgi:hypothetical protein